VFKKFLEIFDDIDGVAVTIWVIWTIAVCSVVVGVVVSRPANKQLAHPATKPLPLTMLYSEEDGWVVKSDFESVAKTQSLMVAEIHSPKDVEGTDHLGFLDTRSCTGMNVALPRKGQKIKVMFIAIRVSGMNNAIANYLGGGPMFFIRPSCIYY
jgi:hypothetical protein